ncbi:hypothetical protein HanIR_Chr12g0592021 [Helianthus annuus]|nr:hypothetical protein HanIR_Chr12g0592021 [Helianthus annuus]
MAMYRPLMLAAETEQWTTKATLPYFLRSSRKRPPAIGVCLEEEEGLSGSVYMKKCCWAGLALAGLSWAGLGSKNVNI